MFFHFKKWLNLPLRGKIFVVDKYLFCNQQRSCEIKQKISPRWGSAKYQKIVCYKDIAPTGALMNAEFTAHKSILILDTTPGLLPDICPKTVYALKKPGVILQDFSNIESGIISP